MTQYWLYLTWPTTKSHRLCCFLTAWKRPPNRIFPLIYCFPLVDYVFSSLLWLCSYNFQCLHTNLPNSSFLDINWISASISMMSPGSCCAALAQHHVISSTVPTSPQPQLTHLSQQHQLFQHHLELHKPRYQEEQGWWTDPFLLPKPPQQAWQQTRRESRESKASPKLHPFSGALCKY